MAARPPQAVAYDLRTAAQRVEMLGHVAIGDHSLSAIITEAADLLQPDSTVTSIHGATLSLRAINDALERRGVGTLVVQCDVRPPYAVSDAWINDPDADGADEAQVA